MERDQVLAGVHNLVHTCADIRKGENVLILNEAGDLANESRQGRVDPELSELIADAVRDAGASCHTMWGVSRGDRSLPPILVGAIAAADKVISHYQLDESALANALGGASRVVYIYSRFRNLSQMGSGNARYHWGMARAIYDRFERELFREGRRWRITTPAGTDISGTIGRLSFGAPFTRDFSSPAHVPVTSVGAEGRIVVRFGPAYEKVPKDPPPFTLRGLDQARIEMDPPPTLVVEDNTVVGAEGPPEAIHWVELFKRILEERLQHRGPNGNSIHSWHSGLNPRAECEPGLAGNGSIDALHFHLGPTVDPVSTKIGPHTLELDGEEIIHRGKFTIVEDPKLEEAARSFGLKEWW